MEGILYLLTNPAMPNLVKIGMTTRDEVQQRMEELYTTGVPVPFECSFAARVPDVKNVEKQFHLAFEPYRINAKREFFEIEAYQAIAILKLIGEEDVTPQISDELDKVDQPSRDAGTRLKQKRRQRFNFIEMGIEEGTVLYSAVNDETCEVVDERKVKFRDEVMTLTMATRIKLDNNYNVIPSIHWTFEGRKLREIYNEVYSAN